MYLVRRNRCGRGYFFTEKRDTLIGTRKFRRFISLFFFHRLSSSCPFEDRWNFANFSLPSASINRHENRLSARRCRRFLARKLKFFPARDKRSPRSPNYRDSLGRYCERKSSLMIGIMANWEFVRRFAFVSSLSAASVGRSLRSGGLTGFSHFHYRDGL